MREKGRLLAAMLAAVAVLVCQSNIASASRAHHKRTAHPADWSPSTSRTEDDPLYLDDTPRDRHAEDDPFYLENYQPRPQRTAQHYSAGGDPYDVSPPYYYPADQFYGYPMPGGYRAPQPGWGMGY